ncbi:MAG: hypothetical protein HC915_14580 [Anaerolineae bacterium]|nr:hypothetical protein [Anaerolineae bacterium]
MSFSEALQDPELRLWDAPAHPRSSDVSTIMTELYSNITIGGQDVAEAAAAAEEAANEVYQEGLADLEG